MALLLENAVFFHTPKTGGTWIRRVLKEAGIPLTELRCKKCVALGRAVYDTCCFHGTHDTIAAPKDGKRRLRFAFVRNPLTYHQSYWAYKMCAGWDFHNPYDRNFAIGDFGAYIRASVAKEPGWIGKFFEEFIGHEDSPIVDFVGRQENIRQDLITALRFAEQPVNEEIILHTPHVNAAASLPEWRERCVYTPELEALVRTSEEWAMRRFGYW